MREFIEKLLAQIREALGKMDRKNKRGLLIIAFLIVVFAIVAVILLSQTTYVTIQNFETIAQAEQVYARLQGAGINARREGTSILVPENQQEHNGDKRHRCQDTPDDEENRVGVRVIKHIHLSFRLILLTKPC